MKLYLWIIEGMLPSRYIINISDVFSRLDAANMSDLYGNNSCLFLCSKEELHFYNPYCRVSNFYILPR